MVYAFFLKVDIIASYPLNNPTSSNLHRTNGKFREKKKHWQKSYITNPKKDKFETFNFLFLRKKAHGQEEGQRQRERNPQEDSPLGVEHHVGPISGP